MYKEILITALLGLRNEGSLSQEDVKEISGLIHFKLKKNKEEL